jgi:hypothetical protein
MMGNAYLVRLRVGQDDLLVDGCPRLPSALLFLQAKAHSGRPANEAWLELEVSHARSVWRRVDGLVTEPRLCACV